MTNRLALIIGTLLVAAILYDAVTNDSQSLIFLARKGFVALDWLAFWR